MSDLLKVKVGGKNYLCKWEKAIGSFIYLTYFNKKFSASALNFLCIDNIFYIQTIKLS